MNKKGNALITIIVFSAVLISVLLSVVVLNVTSINSNLAVNKYNKAFYIAESGAHNGLLQLIRNPSYTGESINVDGGVANITVTSYPNFVLTSVGDYNNYSKTIVISGEVVNNKLTINSWEVN